MNELRTIVTHSVTSLAGVPLVLRILSAKEMPNKHEIAAKMLLCQVVADLLGKGQIGKAVKTPLDETTMDSLFAVEDTAEATRSIVSVMGEFGFLPVTIVAIKPKVRWRISYPETYSRPFEPGVPFKDHIHPAFLSLGPGSAFSTLPPLSKRVLDQLRLTAWPFGKESETR